VSQGISYQTLRPEPNDRKMTLDDQKARMLELSTLLNGLKRDRETAAEALPDGPSKVWIISAIDNKIISTHQATIRCAMGFLLFNKPEKTDE
jgi:hypothetical protein